MWAASYDGTAEELAALDEQHHGSPEWKIVNEGKNGSILKGTVSIAEEVWHPTP